ncbi:aminotransferase class I/II-fold pyridoxal phosphate-dependent enzyme [Nonlabens ponticola]|uniref:8-amino-7-oxononanoate synthase n=1 Tax=Nonlabens ponticola TaxID=2496866 RepID=A0A3S9MVQ2_9FLAO|nr:8-amino-7-oxononanoate synthase [Nonlabens ponticola]AZQ43260.1 8-amino-7-oxononanoate synthase [Nonlabens ponticola]
MLPDKLLARLTTRHQAGSMRELKVISNLIDFASNDYLGYARHKYDIACISNGATGSRLLTGQSILHQQVEEKVAHFHEAESALLFNSGYDANLGLISSVALRGDLILYDELVHASIRDAINLSYARALKFRHNDLGHLSILLEKFSDGDDRNVYIITESVFSMDGDTPNLVALVELAQTVGNAHIILDEAHATGVIGNKGQGAAQAYDLNQDIFARVVTFSKSLGCHGAAVLGGFDLTQYLVNYARSFIYTTALPQHALHTILAAYDQLQQDEKSVQQLQSLIAQFNKMIVQNGLRLRFRESVTPIQLCIIKGNERTRRASQQLAEAGFDVRPILSPTVPAGHERLRICLHTFNTPQQCEELLQKLANIIKEL